MKFSVNFGGETEPLGGETHPAGLYADKPMMQYKKLDRLLSILMLVIVHLSTPGGVTGVELASPHYQSYNLCRQETEAILILSRVHMRGRGVDILLL